MTASGWLTFQGKSQSFRMYIFCGDMIGCRTRCEPFLRLTLSVIVPHPHSLKLLQEVPLIKVVAVKVLN